MTLQLNRQAEPIKMRNYGRIVQNMIRYACSVENPQERASLEVYIAQCMRQRNLVWNRDQESGLGRVREDIIRLSDGKLTCDSPIFERMMSQASMTGNSQRKKRNK